MIAAFQVAAVVNELVTQVIYDVQQPTQSKTLISSNQSAAYDFYGVTQRSNLNTQCSPETFQFSLNGTIASFGQSSDRNDIDNKEDLPTITSGMYDPLPGTPEKCDSTQDDPDPVSAASESSRSLLPDVPSTFCSTMLQQWMHFRAPHDSVAATKVPDSTTNRSIISEMIQYLHIKANTLDSGIVANSVTSTMISKSPRQPANSMTTDLEDDTNPLLFLSSTPWADPPNDVDDEYDDDDDPNAEQNQANNCSDDYQVIDHKFKYPAPILLRETKPKSGVTKKWCPNVGLSRKASIKSLHPKARFNSIVNGFSHNQKKQN